MKKITPFTLVLTLCLTFLCVSCKTNTESGTFVKIKTTMGNITVRLYDDTPLHRDNFVNLCSTGAYDGVLFHRVIADFIVQGGDPESKARVKDAMYGSGDGGFTVPAEILPKYYNKKGALIDAKEGDESNPLRASAGTHFCLTVGRVLTDEQLDKTEERLNNTQSNYLYYRYSYELQQANPDMSELELNATARIMADEQMEKDGPVVIPEAHRQVYRTIGGNPHLDGNVTIFGEVADKKSQMIVDKISKVKTDVYDRPTTDVVILSTKVYRK